MAFLHPVSLEITVITPFPRGWLQWVLGPLAGAAHLPHDGFGSHVRTIEQRIPIGQEGIALSDGFSDEPGVLLPEEPGFPALGLYAGVAAEEGLVGSSLVPAH